MNTDQAQSAVSLSAFVVAAVWGYRKLVETPTGSKTTPPTSHFVLGFGFAYILMSLIAQGAPAFGGSLAILVAIGDLLVQGNQLIDDITHAMNNIQQGTSSTPAAQPAATTPARAPAPAAAAPATGWPTRPGPWPPAHGHVP